MDGGEERRAEQQRVAEAAWTEHTDDAEIVSRQAKSCCLAVWVGAGPVCITFKLIRGSFLFKAHLGHWDGKRRLGPERV